MSNRSPETTEVVLRSPALYLGEVRVTETRQPGSSSLRSGRKVKDLLQPLLFWFLKEAPPALAIAPLRLITGVARALYRVPGNPLRQACVYVCAIAARHGRQHEPKLVYRQFLRNVVNAGRGYQRLLRGGPEAVLDGIRFGVEERRRVEQLLAEHGGCILACPHNPGSAFSAVRMNQHMPLLVVMKNSATIRRTRLALESFERMQARIIMVRSGNPFELSRAMFTALKDGHVIGATVDNIDRGEGGVSVRMFDMEIPLAPWAAKIAAKKKVPVLPSFYHSRADGVDVVLGEPLVTDDLQQAMQHYASFFEARILEDPASWAYLADRKWRRVLRQAAGYA
ncbi:MAG: hypothetical protein BMS9Abin32_115 [Gammaproteobacteria bacterium]|nr:MAG: hypothetical protein BMS9Abin32_115 [Gammaproteobacteria bacterium]